MSFDYNTHYQNVICALTPFVALTGLDMMLDQNRLEDLSLLFDLLSRTKDGVKELLVSFAAYIKVCFDFKMANR